jgi:hypothetical protein
MLHDDVRSIATGLLDEAPCQVVLPAGAGKTELVAATVRVAGERGVRTLVLTHTHAGVDAMRRRLSRLGAMSGSYKVATIDGWCLRWAESFPRQARYSASNGPDWHGIRTGAAEVVGSPHVTRTVRASYGLLIIDEYQDCSVAQHAVAMGLAIHVPTIVLGDPMQAIYGFSSDGDPAITWEDHLDGMPVYDVGAQPWRWHDHNPTLGGQLSEVRSQLIGGNPVDLTSYDQIRWVEDSDEARRRAAWSATGHTGSVVVLERWPAGCIELARKLRGTYGTMEELAGNRLLTLAAAIDGDDGVAAAAELIGFATGCHAKLPPQLASKGRAMTTSGHFPGFKTTNSIASTLEAIREFSVTQSPGAFQIAMDRIESLNGTRFGKEAWSDMRSAARLWHDNEETHTCTSAVRAIRDRSRVLGRRTERRCVSRTVLVKGLEFDHCIVNRANELNRYELYVAMTRGRCSLTVLSKSQILSPA